MFRCKKDGFKSLYIQAKYADFQINNFVKNSSSLLAFICGGGEALSGLVHLFRELVYN